MRRTVRKVKVETPTMQVVNCVATIKDDNTVDVKSIQSGRHICSFRFTDEPTRVEGKKKSDTFKVVGYVEDGVASIEHENMCACKGTRVVDKINGKRWFAR